jgi:predicted alpha-1,2-mannosidase
MKWIAAAALLVAASATATERKPADPAALVNVFIGTTNGGNVFPGATLPFGMVSFSPEETPLPGSGLVVAAPGGYEWRSNGVRGFGLAHVSGSGCAGAGGDIPIMPVTREIKASPSIAPNVYSAFLDHSKETASPGAYSVELGNGVAVDLSATLRTGVARFAFAKDKPANLLFRTSDTEVGSSDASIHIDAAHRTVSGSVTSGNFCGYLSPDRRRSYYTLHFVAMFDQDFTVGGTWTGGAVTPGSITAQGGTAYGEDGFPVPGKGSGGWISFDPAKSPTVNMRVGISYIDEAGARANLEKESPAGRTLEATRAAARAAWNGQLGRIAISGGTADDRTVFTSALYHALIDPSIYSDVDGRYRGMDGQVHRVAKKQAAQYANFSGWDVYRSQVQLVTLLDPKVGSDFAQSLLNQADQFGGQWDRWTHLTGPTGVMNGDPSAPSVAAIYAFGGRDFDVRAAYRSLLKAATVPTANDLSRTGCPVLCAGQRPGLDQWLKLHYMPVGAPGWGSAADTLELAAADFGLAQLARMVGDKANERRLLERSGWWRNLFNPKSGYIQPRNADGSWPAFDPASDEEFVEGSGAVYRWMVPFDPAGLFEALGGREKAMAEIDRFFRDSDGNWAVTKAGPLHSELDNEPSVGSPWLYDFAGAPWKTQAVAREAMRRIWTNSPHGISGNDDLGEMSSWYVWAAMGLYPLYPGRADLVIGSPLFPDIRIDRPGAPIHIVADGAAADAPYVHALSVNGRATSRPWLDEGFVRRGGELRFSLSSTPDEGWGAAPQDAPPSYGPR